MGNLHKWFKGSKSKDGKSGWVNVKTGGTCASDEPGEGTPKCVSSSKRASMTKSERESASRRKKAADPGQQQKSGAAKPTYVSTDKPKKMKKEQFSNWRDDYVATEHEFIDLIKPEPMVSEASPSMMQAGQEFYKRQKEGGTMDYESPRTKARKKAEAKAKRSVKEETKQDGPEPTAKQRRMAMSNIRQNKNRLSHEDPDKKKTKQELAFQKARAKAFGMKEEMSDHDKEVAKYREQAKKKTTMPKGDVGHDIHKRAVDQYNKQNPTNEEKDPFNRPGGKYGGVPKKGSGYDNAYKAIMKKNKEMDQKEEVTFSEEDKKGSGSGKKDACYKKVKASASVWPSAYASGRLVQCRKKGADNYGKSKNEEFVSVVASEYFINEGLNEEGVAELIELLGPIEFGELVNEIAEGVEEELLTEARAGGVRIEPQNKSGKRVADLTKGAKTRAINTLRKEKQTRRAGEGSGGSGGLKDALKSQSKTAKKVEPKKEAPKKPELKKPQPKKEAAKPAVAKAKAKQPKKRGFLDSVARQVNKGMERHKKAMDLARQTGNVAKKAAKGAGTVAKGVASGVKDTAKVTKSVADKLKEEYVSELKCWKGYKRKKGSTPGAPGSCVKAGYSDWKGELNLMDGISVWVEGKYSSSVRATYGGKTETFQKELYKKKSKLKSKLKEGAAWTKKEGKNKEGGLNEKGRKSYERENPGSDLKAPQPEGGSRKKSFCSRMSGMKKKLTSKKTANDPDSRINKSLRKWKC